MGSRNVIFGAVKVRYKEIPLTTEKAFCAIFSEEQAYWFPKTLTKIDEENKTLTMPHSFAEERDILKFIVKPKLETIKLAEKLPF